jgi:hypothetical protein
MVNLFSFLLIPQRGYPIAVSAFYVLSLRAEALGVSVPLILPILLSAHAAASRTMGSPV